MQVVRFVIASHYSALSACLKAWGVDPQPEDEVPATGFVALIEGIPAAFAFIRLVEGGYGQLDGLTSNLDFPGDFRSEALNAVVERLIDQAKHMKLKGLMAYTRDKHTISRAMKFGFATIPQTLIALDLKRQAE